MSSNSKKCCTLIFSTGLTALVIWLILITAHLPKLSLLDLNLPMENTNSSITFKLKLDNPNIWIGIYYSNLNTSFHYPSNNSSPFAEIIVPSFYQGHRKKAVKIGTGETRNVNWTEVVGLGANGTGVQVKVHVDGSVKFKYIWWRSKKRRVSVEGVAGVDGHGVLADDGGLRLKSNGAKRFWDMKFGLALLLVVIFF